MYTYIFSHFSMLDIRVPS